MFIPEYTVTSRIIANISSVEYNKGVIENTLVLPSWEKQLRKDAIIRITLGNLKVAGVSGRLEEIKKVLDGIIPPTTNYMQNIKDAIEYLGTVDANSEIDELNLKNLHKILTLQLINERKLGAYRSIKIPGYPDPEEILAEMVEFFDWYSSVEARELHPVIRAAITKAQIDRIIPYEVTNDLVSNFSAYLVLYSGNFRVNQWYSMEDYYNQSKIEHEKIISRISENHLDFTEFIEFFTDSLNKEMYNLKEKIRILSRETKISKSSGKHKLTPRQQRIIEYLQDYAVLYNRDFVKIFPDKSEDSVLRDLKVLVNTGIVLKVGTTKSSRYELAG